MIKDAMLVTASVDQELRTPRRLSLGHRSTSPKLSIDVVIIRHVFNLAQHQKAGLPFPSARRLRKPWQIRVNSAARCLIKYYSLMSGTP